MGPEFDAWIKNLQEGGIFTDIHQLWQKFGELLERALKDAGERTIVTKFGDSSFKTTVALDNDITNEFPETGPKDDDIYWKRHQELVDNILNTRKEIVLKIIETVGVTIKGVINPISVSNVDIAKIIENFTKKQ
ncbi:MAG: hypothetical protein IIA82_00980 [Thaumarchaeota archaeon]|nr:hypothetical protein [Nitrososphaerota archaeon]